MNASDLGITGIDHLVLRVVDLKAMVAFYRDVLGCSVERELPEAGFTQLRAGPLADRSGCRRRELGRPGGAAPALEGRNLDHFCLALRHFPEADLRAYLAGHASPSPAKASVTAPKAPGRHSISTTPRATR